MYRNRKGRVDPARQWTGVQGPPAQPNIPLPVQEQRQAEKESAVIDLGRLDAEQSQAAYDNLVSRGTISAVERVGRVEGIAAITPPVVIVTYTVPSNFVFRWARLGFAFSDPIAHQLNLTTMLPWNVLVNGTPVPGLAEANSLPYLVGPGGIFWPMEFDPIWLQGEDVVEVSVRTSPAVTIEVAAIARIGGWLHDRTGLRLGVNV